jgi:hypothetical protein
MKKILVAILLVVATQSQAQHTPSKLLKTVQIKGLTADLEVLTSDSLEGRNTGEPGAEKAARYIENRFRKMGLEPFDGTSYRQEFNLWKSLWHPVALSINNTPVSSDLITYLGWNPQNDPIKKEVVFVGNGNDTIISQLQLDGKIALVALDNLKLTHHIKSQLEKQGVWAVFAFNPSNKKQYNDIRTNYLKFLNSLNVSTSKPSITEKGSRLYVLSDTLIAPLTGFTSEELTKLTTQQVVEASLTKEVVLQTQLEIVSVPVWNIIGTIKGKLPERKTIALTAHYDHVGRQPNGEICRGADDNASGVAAILQVAQSLKRKSKQPDHDIMVMAFTGEEMGLLGSSHFMAKRDPKQFIANINIDMIGRQDTLGHDDYVYILGADETHWLDSLYRSENQKSVNLKLDLHYANEKGMSGMMNRSDHYHFYRQNIPVIAFFSGLHDDYHTSRDTMDKLDLELMAKRVKLILATVYQLSHLPVSNH